MASPPRNIQQACRLCCIWNSSFDIVQAICCGGRLQKPWKIRSPQWRAIRASQFKKVNPADHATCPQRVTDWGRQLGASTQSQKNQIPKGNSDVSQQISYASGLRPSKGAVNENAFFNIICFYRHKVDVLLIMHKHDGCLTGVVDFGSALV